MGGGVADGRGPRIRPHPRRQRSGAYGTSIGDVLGLESGYPRLDRGGAAAGDAPAGEPNRLAVARQRPRHRRDGAGGNVCRLCRPGAPGRPSGRRLGRPGQRAGMAAPLRRDHGDRLDLPRRPAALPALAPLCDRRGDLLRRPPRRLTAGRRTLRGALRRPIQPLAGTVGVGGGYSVHAQRPRGAGHPVWRGAGDADPIEALERDRTTAIPLAGLCRLLDPRGGGDLPDRERDRRRRGLGDESSPWAWR